MPGSLELIEPSWLRGRAYHPMHPGYPMVVHALAGGRVVSSVLADLAHAEGGGGFALPINPALDLQRVEVLLGETDELLPWPGPRARARAVLSVEDLIATPVRRPWVNGGCHLDAQQARLRPETIIDLLCRDYLGRPAGPVVITTALAHLATGGYDDVRRMLLGASEYTYRRIHADVAPGAIFSQSMVTAAATGDFTSESQRDATVTEISARPLLLLEGEAFVTACYRQILRKQPDRGGMSHYLQQLAEGGSKAAIIAHLGREFETISAGIVIIDLPD